jgi:hypothetical protein
MMCLQAAVGDICMHLSSCIVAEQRVAVVHPGPATLLRFDVGAAAVCVHMLLAGHIVGCTS